MSDQQGAKTVPDNPPAFPQGVADPAYLHPDWHGMSLRDYFAGQALAGLLASNVEEAFNGDRHDKKAIGIWKSNVHAAWAEFSYSMADAMLHARAKDTDHDR